MKFIDLLNSGKTIIYDGGMGTEIASRLNEKFKISDFKCGEEINLTYPEIIQSIHEDYFRAGANVVETNTFGASRIVLAEHGLEDKIREINMAAVAAAKRARDYVRSLPFKGGSGRVACNLTSTPSNSPFEGGEHKMFIAGDIGPTSKLPTLGHISFDEMVAAYSEQASILIEAGVDIIQICTCQDILQVKAAIIGTKLALKNLSTQEPKHLSTIPIVATITLETSGTTLLGTEIGAALVSLADMGISAIGLNCATGPKEMESSVKFLGESSPIPIAILPNAGLPQVKDGKAFYPLSPVDFGKQVARFVKEYGIRIVGGCCGTTPEHIRELANAVSCQTGSFKGSNVKRLTLNASSSLFSAVPLDQEPRPLIVGERMNINGSKEFREYILNSNYDAATALAKKQASMGAHVLDLSVAYAGRDEIKDMDEMASRLAKSSPLPIVIDSTNPDAIETALKHFGGRSIINSINLEDGGKKAEKIIALADKYSAVLIALTIDEQGMALSKDRKITVAKRLIELCRDSSVLLDLLTFTLADPKAAENGSGLETLEALKQIKKLKRGNVRTLLGVSNISYGFKPIARKILNSVFLHEAVEAGLDAAIIHPGQILPMHKIDKETLKITKDLIYCKGKDCLKNFVNHFESQSTASRPADLRTCRPEDMLKTSIIDGNKEEANAAILELIKSMPPADIINKLLLPTMQRIGEMFGCGEMVLPFVLGSAETMRACVDALAPYMDKKAAEARGTIVLATVRGDVHDIGKNLVDIILSNNGYKVVNLGVKQTAEQIMKAAKDNKANAIGLSGLLVQSCMAMREDLLEMSQQGINIPVICGGAALTKKFVDDELAKAYKGKVFYARDAFDGLNIMNSLPSKGGLGRVDTPSNSPLKGGESI